MTNKVYEVPVRLDTPELKQPNNGYRLENIENVIDQLLVPPYKPLQLRSFYYFLSGKIFVKRKVITLFISFALSFVFKSLNDI